MIVVGRPDCAAGAVRWPVSWKPNSEPGHEAGGRSGVQRRVGRAADRPRRVRVRLVQGARRRSELTSRVVHIVARSGTVTVGSSRTRTSWCSST